MRHNAALPHSRHIRVIERNGKEQSSRHQTTSVVNCFVNNMAKETLAAKPFCFAIAENQAPANGK